MAAAALCNAMGANDMQNTMSLLLKQICFFYAQTPYPQL